MLHAAIHWGAYNINMNLKCTGAEIIFYRILRGIVNPVRAVFKLNDQQKSATWCFVNVMGPVSSCSRYYFLFSYKWPIGSLFAVPPMNYSTNWFVTISVTESDDQMIRWKAILIKINTVSSEGVFPFRWCWIILWIT